MAPQLRVRIFWYWQDSLTLALSSLYSWRKGWRGTDMGKANTHLCLPSLILLTYTPACGSLHPPPSCLPLHSPVFLFPTPCSGPGELVEFRTSSTAMLLLFKAAVVR